MTLGSVVYLASDQIIANEPSAPVLPLDVDLGLRPVDSKNIGATDETAEMFPYLKNLYRLLDVNNPYRGPRRSTNPKYFIIGTVAWFRPDGKPGYSASGRRTFEK